MEGFGEVRDVGGLVLAAEEDLVFGDFAAAGGGDDFLDEGAMPAALFSTGKEALRTTPWSSQMRPTCLRLA